jgi:large subunit ribosomal protein L9
VEVILREDVTNLGVRGDVVKVADGYGRNYLLPRGLAMKITPGNLKQIEQEKRRIQAREVREKAEAERIKSRLEDLSVTIKRKVGETETLYGSVTAGDIADAMAEKGHELDKRKIQLDEPIKALGDYQVAVKIHREVTAQLKVWVVKDD